MAEHDIFTQDWADAYHAALGGNGAYKEAARDWEGPLALLVRANPAHGIAEDRAVVLDLWHGDCRTARAEGRDAAYAAADFVIEGDRNTWKEVIEGRLDPLKGLMFGKLRLKKGRLTALLPYTRASKELVKSAQEVPTHL